MSTREIQINRVARWFPFLLLTIAVAGFGTTIVLRRYDLSIFSLYVVIPLLFGFLILLSKKKINIDSLDLTGSSLHLFPNLFLINVVIFLLTLALLFFDTTRSLWYFALISLYAGNVLLQILTQRAKWTDTLILFEIVFLSLNTIWGVTLKYPLYFGDTDTLVHMSMIDTIVKTSHANFAIAEYINYPIYHIFNSIGVELTGMSIRTTVFVLMGLVWQIGTLFTFLLFKKISASTRFALIACLLFATASQVMFYGSYAIARSLAFIFFLYWFYLLLTKNNKDNRYLVLSLIAMSAMIMTHHLNVLFVIPTVILIYFVQSIFMKKAGPDRLINPTAIYLFVVCCLFYLIWVASDLANSTFPGTIRALIDTKYTLNSSPSEGFGFSVILGVIYYSFVILLCCAGMRVVFEQLKSIGKQLIAGVFALAGFLLLIVYIPGPLDLIQFSDILSTSRMQLIVSPIVAFLMACGIYYLVKRNSRSNFAASSFSFILPVILVVAATFFSAIGTGNAQDNDVLPDTKILDTPYFTQSELDSYAFMNEQADGSLPFYADYQTIRNFFSLTNYLQSNALTGADISSIRNGYVIFRIGELERKKALTFISPDNAKIALRYSLDPQNPQSNIIMNLETEDKIFSNGYVVLYFAH